MRFFYNILRYSEDLDFSVINSDIDKNNIKEVLVTRIRELRWEKVKDDLFPFIELKQDFNLVTRDNCLKLISEKHF